MTRKSLHLKRFAATSLCLVMCLSSLAVLAPSASAAEDVMPLDTVRGGKVCITFDDGYKSVHDVALPALSAHGMVATAYVITEYINKTLYDLPCMDAADLQALQAAGWEIGSHSVSHEALATLSAEDATAQFRDSKAALEALGLDVTTFAYPYGNADNAYNTETVALGAEYYSRQRSTDADYLFLQEYPSAIQLVGAHTANSISVLNHILNAAAYSDSTVVLIYHGLAPDGLLYGGQGASTNLGYSIHDLIAAIEARGMETILFRDLPQSDRNVYVWDNGGATDLASDPANWYRVSADGTITDDAPLVSDAYYWWSDGSANCTLDWGASSIVPYAIMMDRYYMGTITLASDKNLRVGDGGIRLYGFEVGDHGTMVPSTDNHITNAGPLITLSRLLPSADLVISYTADRTIIAHGFAGRPTIYGDAYLLGPRAYHYPGGSDIPKLRIMPGASLCVSDGSKLLLKDFASVSDWANYGLIYGDGAVEFRYAHSSPGIARTFGTVMCDATIRLHEGMTGSAIVLFGGDAIFRDLSIYSDSDHDMTVDLAGHSLTASSVVVGSRGAIGNGTVVTSSWDSTEGTLLDDTNVVLSDGGSAVLAPGQSFNELYIASDDGRSATWSMTATGAQAPIVTGLKSGSYLWYLDGVEQGEVKAGKDGTIALSYQSTGLYTLEVKPTSMTLAMDGLAAAVGIVAVLAVLGGLFTMLGRLKF